MSKHTRGNWFVKENGGKGELVGIASTGSNWFVAEEVLPDDAHLIASAPELLDIADAVCKQYSMAGIQAVEDSLDPTEALLFRALKVRAKAKGETP